MSDNRVVEDDNRATPWPGSVPRQRRRWAWKAGQPRERRRTRWTEFRGAYPRIVTAMSLGMAVLLLLDTVLLVKRHRYREEDEAARRLMTGMEKQQADALVTGEGGRAALTMALVRGQSIKDRRLNLSIALDEGTMDLQQEGAQLREMRVRIGPEQIVGPPPGERKVTPPLGQRRVARVVDESFVWEVPEWVYTQRGQPVPPDRNLRGALGEVAVILDDGTCLYSLPGAGPLADPAYVLPGGVRAEAADLRAIRVNLEPGVPVYFH